MTFVRECSGDRVDACSKESKSLKMQETHSPDMVDTRATSKAAAAA